MLIFSQWHHTPPEGSPRSSRSPSVRHVARAHRARGGVRRVPPPPHRRRVSPGSGVGGEHGPVRPRPRPVCPSSFHDDATPPEGCSRSSQLSSIGHVARAHRARGGVPRVPPLAHRRRVSPGAGVGGEHGPMRPRLRPICSSSHRDTTPLSRALLGRLGRRQSGMLSGVGTPRAWRHATRTSACAPS